MFTWPHFDICLAENVTKKWNISKQEQDEFALTSQPRCEAAQAKSAFDEEIIPVTVANRKGTFFFFIKWSSQLL